MVFFTCDGCNESLKKNKVDQHMQRCRSCFSVSCIDCSQTFEGRSYAKHTSCISEAEKYQGALYKSKGKKKITPQQIWMNAVSEVTSGVVPANIRGVVATIGAYDNVPRKKKKFVNYLKNSCRHIDEDKIEQIWTLLSDKFESMRPKKVEVPVKKKVVTPSNDSDSSEWEDSDDDDDDDGDNDDDNKIESTNTSSKRKLSSDENTSSVKVDSKKWKTLYFMLVLNRAKRRRVEKKN